MLAESLSPVTWGEAVLRLVQPLNHGLTLLTTMEGGTFPLQLCLGAGHLQQSSPRSVSKGIAATSSLKLRCMNTCRL